jgi:hypothetical protein
MAVQPKSRRGLLIKIRAGGTVAYLPGDRR